MERFPISFSISLGIHLLFLVLVGCFAIKMPANPQAIVVAVDLIEQELQTAAQQSGGAAAAKTIAMAPALYNKPAAIPNPQALTSQQETVPEAKNTIPEALASLQQASALPNGITKGNNPETGVAEASSGSGGNGGSGASLFDGGGFSQNADGTYTALNTDGINYTIISQIEPVYPDEARSMSYSKAVVVSTRFVIGLEGQVESIEFLNTAPNLGFKEATLKALAQWKFAPIYFHGVNIKCTFVKDFYFYPR